MDVTSGPLALGNALSQMLQGFGQPGAAQVGTSFALEGLGLAWRQVGGGGQQAAAPELVGFGDKLDGPCPGKHRIEEAGRQALESEVRRMSRVVRSARRGLAAAGGE